MSVQPSISAPELTSDCFFEAALSIQHQVNHDEGDEEHSPQSHVSIAVFCVPGCSPHQRTFLSGPVNMESSHEEFWGILLLKTFYGTIKYLSSSP